MYHIIYNPIAGRGFSKTTYLPMLADMFEKYNLPFTAHETAGPKHAYDIANHLCTQSPSGIVGVGGDGTIQEIVAGMADTFPDCKIPIPLGIFPGGSGNDFAMAIEGGKSAMRKKLRNNSLTEIFVERIHLRKLRTIDLISVNGEAYLVAGNMGIDARIVRDATELKPRFGGQAYLVAAYKSIMNHKNIPMTLNIDGEVITKDFTLVAICNNSTYGGGLSISPSAKFDDGKITLCMVDGMSRLKLGVLFPSLLFKKHIYLKAISFTDCREVIITLPPGTETLCLDGNLFPKEGELHFKILPQILDVFG